MESWNLARPPKPARDVIALWLVFFCVAVVLNGTIPFLAGADLRWWTYSLPKGVLFEVLIYGVLFLAAPILLVKGRSIVRDARLWIPLCIALIALGFHPVFRPTAIVAFAALLYLHVRFDLSPLGVKRFWTWPDVTAILILGLLPLVARGLDPRPLGWHPRVALGACFDRLFLNPASTNENLFYFGLLAERLGPWAGRWPTSLLTGALYTAHEMSNPEYWYEDMKFPLAFVGVAVTTAVYLWRRNTVVVWLGSGLARFAAYLW